MDFINMITSWAPGEFFLAKALAIIIITDRNFILLCILLISYEYHEIQLAMNNCMDFINMIKSWAPGELNSCKVDFSCPV